MFDQGTGSDIALQLHDLRDQTGGQDHRVATVVAVGCTDDGLPIIFLKGPEKQVDMRRFELRHVAQQDHDPGKFIAECRHADLERGGHAGRVVGVFGEGYVEPLKHRSDVFATVTGDRHQKLGPARKRTLSNATHQRFSIELGQQFMTGAVAHAA